MAQKKIADVIAEVFQANITGILTFSTTRDTSLFKLFFRDGQVYHITHSTCKDKDCLVGIEKLQFKVGMFMPGAQVDSQEGSRLPGIPKQDVLAAFSRNSNTIEWAGQWNGRSETPGKEQAALQRFDKEVVARVGEELLNLAGPVGPIVLENAFKVCRLQQGKPLTGPEFQKLIQRIAGQLPEEQGREFVKRFSADIRGTAPDRR